MNNITVLIEDLPSKDKRMESEKGLSILLEKDNDMILFDTGTTGKFIKNASLLSKNLHRVRSVVLSHGHNDHTGGFKKYVHDFTSGFKVVASDKLFIRKYLDDGAGIDYIGNNFEKEFLNEHDIEFIPVENKLKLYDNTYVINLEGVNGNLPNLDRYLIKNGNSYVVDSFDDEVALAILNDNGVVVITACAHKGITVICERAKEIFNCELAGVVGGLHLKYAEKEYLDSTIEYFKNNHNAFLAVGHCTGLKQMQYLKEKLGDRVTILNTGYHLSF